MRVTVRLFARLREIAGQGELTRDVAGGSTVQDLWDGLVGEFPALGPYARSVAPGVNAEYSRMTAALAEGDDVAFLPPVSGGDQLRSQLCSTN
jgi:molybdopterin converting factor small subunit